MVAGDGGGDDGDGDSRLDWRGLGIVTVMAGMLKLAAMTLALLRV